MKQDSAFPDSGAYCHAKLPNAGLGNKLFVWARALVFARQNHLPLVVTGWLKFQTAPILAGGDFRFYWNYFRPVKEVNFFRRQAVRRHARIVNDPPIGMVSDSSPVIYEFSRIPPWQEHFQELKPHRQMIRQSLMDLLTPARRSEFQQMHKPAICIQVRMGDFRTLSPSESFAQVGGVRTPLEYYTGLINQTRKVNGSELPVTVVSDGSEKQLRTILNIPGVVMGPPNSKIIDILMMSASRILIPAAGSTFGYWAGFLGDCALLIHPDHVHQTIRPEAVNQKSYEGPAIGDPAQWPDLLKANIKAIGG